MQTTVEQPLSVAAFYRERIAAREGENGERARKNAGKKPIGATGVYEVYCLALALFLFSAPAFAGMSSVSIGANVKFTQFELVRVLDQHFTVEMQAQARTPYDTEKTLGEETVIIL